MAIGQDVKTVSVEVGTTAAGTDDEIPVFVAPHGTRLLKAYLVDGGGVTADATDYTTLSIVNKGSDGSGTDTVASFDTDSNGDNVSLTAFDAHDFGTLANYSLSQEDVVTLKKADTASGQALTTATVVLVYESKPGLKQFES